MSSLTENKIWETSLDIFLSSGKKNILHWGDKANGQREAKRMKRDEERPWDSWDDIKRR